MPAVAEPSALCGDELLVAIFGQFKPGSTFRINDENSIIDALYRAKHNGAYDSFFENYPFDEDGVEPRSSELSDALHALQQTRLLGRMNPALVRYTISPALRLSYERYVRQRVADEEDKLKELADVVRLELSIEDPK